MKQRELHLTTNTKHDCHMCWFNGRTDCPEGLNGDHLCLFKGHWVLKPVEDTASIDDLRADLAQAVSAVDDLMAGNDKLQELIDQSFEREQKLVREKEVLREALRPFSDGSRRAEGKPAWASSYVCPTKYAIADHVYKETS